LKAGRISKRQLFILPGGMPVVLNIRSYTVRVLRFRNLKLIQINNAFLRIYKKYLKVVQDCINEISEHLGLSAAMAIDNGSSFEQLEFAIYYVVESGFF
jgi:hypothetical protein